MLKFSIWNQTAWCEVVSIKMEDYINRKWKTTFFVPPITFQAEPNILPFDLGHSCHMDILRWQRVDSLQFHGLFETVLGLLLADKQRGGKKNHSTHTDGIHFHLYIHTPHSSALAVCLSFFEKEVTVSHLLMAHHTVDTWKQLYYLMNLLIKGKTAFKQSVMWQMRCYSV